MSNWLVPTRVCDMKVEAAAFLFFLHPLPERM